MQEDRQKYGSLLPKSGVYFLPDEKVVGFLKLLNRQRVLAGKEDDYPRARELKRKFDEFSKAEQQRQEQNMRIAQEKELLNIESAQRQQFVEFSEAWDKYMADYEATAFELIS